MIGDFNLCMDRWDEKTYQWKTVSDHWRIILKENGLMYENIGVTFESFYTLQNGTKVKSALDHVYHTSNSIFKESRKIPNSLSDHCPVVLNIQLKPNKAEQAEKKFILKRSYKKFVKGDFLCDLAAQPWEDLVGLDVNKMTEKFDEILEKTLDRHAPVKKIRIHENYRKGLSDETLRLMKERDQARKEVSKCQAEDRDSLVEKYKKARNSVTARIRTEAYQDTINQLTSVEGPSHCWKKVKSINNSSKDTNPELIENGQTVKDEKELTNIHNTHFKDKIEKIEREIPKTDESPTRRLKESLEGRGLKFGLRQVTEKQIEKAIKSLKNKSSSGTDFVSPKVIKMAVDILKIPLWYIVNTSIVEGEFPASWKLAKVTPIFKNKGSRKDKKNYRPVSNLKSASKVLELIVNQQVLRYFETNNLFPRSQFGFRAKRSTFSAIASMHETWIERYQRGQHTAVTFFDLSAAFDTLSKDIFCDKLRIYGFDKTSVEWFNSYLSGRRQVVMIGSAISEECQLTVGSPQGAILSPTIFIILVADVGL